ncbi:MAG: hypothetical protein FJ266_05285 [Planctomycetes bacterium]|nr:hypothetical protein [Planctomycetota bacterium]
MGVKLNSSNSNISCRVMIVASFALLLTWANMESVYGETYEDVLKEVRFMQSRISSLEQLILSQQEEIKKLRAEREESASAQAMSTVAEQSATRDVATSSRHKKTQGLQGEREESSSVKVASGEAIDVVEPDDEDTLETRLKSFKEELFEKMFGGKAPLEITGFFDFTLQSQDERDSPFEYGAFELDLEYAYNEHYAVSTALVWEDDSASVGVGVIDYHLFKSSVPVRGRIFDEPGFHVQAGRFDLPYGVDYQYFASVDRPNVSAPLTTERIQLGGYNSDGIRLYGTEGMFDYSLYAVDSLYGDNGSAVGGRMAFFPSRNPYKLHQFGTPRFAELGFSFLIDMDRDYDMRNGVYGFDFTLNYDKFLLVTEWMNRNSYEDILSGTDVNLGEQDESGFHVTLVTELEDFVKQPVYFFSRYDMWDPRYSIILDEDDDTIAYRVNDTKRLTFGVGYRLIELLNIKLEYFNYLGRGTNEPAFDDSGVIVQMTARF